MGKVLAMQARGPDSIPRTNTDNGKPSVVAAAGNPSSWESEASGSLGFTGHQANLNGEPRDRDRNCHEKKSNDAGGMTRMIDL